MKVALAQVHDVGNVAVEPLGICQLAAYLRRLGHEVELFDVNVRGVEPEHLLGAVLEFAPKLIGITAPWEAAEGPVLDFAQRLRDEGFEGFLCAGGMAVSMSPDSYAKPGTPLDAAIVGEGEIPLEAILAALDSGSSWRAVRGLAFNDPIGGLPRRTGIADVIGDMDSLPFSARDLLAEHLSVMGTSTVAAMCQSRGCYKRCSFCSTQELYRKMPTRVHRRRGMESVVEEMRQVYEKYGVHRFTFEDDQFLVPGPVGLRRIQEFHMLVKELPFKPWIRLAARVDSFSSETLTLLEESGLRHIFTGIETFNERDLHLYRKGTTVPEMIRGMEELARCGWSAAPGSERQLECGFISFNPCSTVETLRHNLKWVSHFKIPFTMLTTKLEMYKGTELKKFFMEEVAAVREGTYFDDPRIGAVHEGFSTLYYFGGVRRWRKRLRTAEKLELDHDGEIRRFRLGLDRQSFAVFSALLDMVDEGRTVREILEYSRQESESVCTRLKDSRVGACIQDLEQRGHPLGMEMR